MRLLDNRGYGTSRANTVVSLETTRYNVSFHLTFLLLTRLKVSFPVGLIDSYLKKHLILNRALLESMCGSYKCYKAAEVSVRFSLSLKTGLDNSSLVQVDI